MKKYYVRSAHKVEGNEWRPCELEPDSTAKRYLIYMVPGEIWYDGHHAEYKYEEEVADKYVVFKKGEWDAWWEVWHGKMTDAIQGHEDPGRMGFKLDELRLEDAVVIRRQDVFAPPALDAYSNTLRTAVEALKAGKGGYNDKLVAHLTEVADYFHEQASLSWETNRKMPD